MWFGSLRRFCLFWVTSVLSDRLMSPCRTKTERWKHPRRCLPEEGHTIPAERSRKSSQRVSKCFLIKRGRFGSTETSRTQIIRFVFLKTKTDSNRRRQGGHKKRRETQMETCSVRTTTEQENLFLILEAVVKLTSSFYQIYFVVRRGRGAELSFAGS